MGALDTKKLVELLLSVSDNMLDSRMKPFVQKWSDPPTALQVLEVLDYCINGSLASGTIISTLQVLYAECCKAENTTHAVVVQQAIWRHA